MFRSLLTKAAPLARGISTSAIRQGGHHETRGIVGSNLPFQIENRYRLLLVFIAYFGSGIGLPFLTLRYMILAKMQT